MSKGQQYIPITAEQAEIKRWTNWNKCIIKKLAHYNDDDIKNHTTSRKIVECTLEKLKTKIKDTKEGNLNEHLQYSIQFFEEELARILEEINKHESKRLAAERGATLLDYVKSKRKIDEIKIEFDKDQYFLKDSRVVNFQDEKDWTPLMFAIYNYDVDVVKYLLSNILIDVFAINKSGNDANTILHKRKEHTTGADLKSLEGIQRLLQPHILNVSSGARAPTRARNGTQRHHQRPQITPGAATTKPKGSIQPGTFKKRARPHDNDPLKLDGLDRNNPNNALPVSTLSREPLLSSYKITPGAALKNDMKRRKKDIARLVKSSTKILVLNRRQATNTKESNDNSTTTKISQNRGGNKKIKKYTMKKRRMNQKMSRKNKNH